jgi:hypothetical protein
MEVFKESRGFDEVTLRRSGFSEILCYFRLPTSIPDVICQTSKTYGSGDYEMVLKTCGITRTKTFEVCNSDYKCPYTNHCSDGTPDGMKVHSIALPTRN